MEALVTVEGLRPAVVYRNAAAALWSAGAAEQAIADTLDRAIRQDYDPRLSADEVDALRRRTAELGHLSDASLYCSRWAVDGCYVSWAGRLGIEHGHRHGIEPAVDVLPFGMNRLPAGASVGIHVDRVPGTITDYKVDQIVVMARPARRGGALVFHPPNGTAVSVWLEAGDVAVFDAALPHEVAEVLEGERYTFTTSTTRESVAVG